MGQAVVVTSGKGGVGKTTTTANVGLALGMLGQRVCLVDTDIGLRNLDLALGLDERVVYDLIDVCSGVCRPQQALLRDKHIESVYLLPAAQTKAKTDITPEQIRTLLQQLKASFDFILLDSPAGIEQGFQNAIAGADWAIVVTNPEPAAVRDADRVIGLLHGAGLTDVRLILNRLRTQRLEARSKAREAGGLGEIEEVVDQLAVDLLGVVPEDERVVDSNLQKEPLVLHQQDRAGQAYREIARRMLGEPIPLMELAPPKPFWRRLGLRFGHHARVERK